jgi:hypothetical protein
MEVIMKLKRMYALLCLALFMGVQLSPAATAVAQGSPVTFTGGDEPANTIPAGTNFSIQATGTFQGAGNQPDGTPCNINGNVVTNNAYTRTQGCKPIKINGESVLLINSNDLNTPLAIDPGGSSVLLQGTATATNHETNESVTFKISGLAKVAPIATTPAHCNTPLNGVWVTITSEPAMLMEEIRKPKSRGCCGRLGDVADTALSKTAAAVKYVTFNQYSWAAIAAAAAACCYVQLLPEQISEYTSIIQQVAYCYITPYAGIKAIRLMLKNKKKTATVAALIFGFIVALEVGHGYYGDLPLGIESVRSLYTHIPSLITDFDYAGTAAQCKFVAMQTIPFCKQLASDAYNYPWMQAAANVQNAVATKAGEVYNYIYATWIPQSQAAIAAQKAAQDVAEAAAQNATQSIINTSTALAAHAQASAQCSIDLANANDALTTAQTARDYCAKIAQTCTSTTATLSEAVMTSQSARDAIQAARDAAQAEYSNCAVSLASKEGQISMLNSQLESSQNLYQITQAKLAEANEATRAAIDKLTSCEASKMSTALTSANMQNELGFIQKCTPAWLSAHICHWVSNGQNWVETLTYQG